MSMVKDVALVPVEDRSVAGSVFERLARDPAVDVDKLERLMQMHERATARMAEEQFNAAMSLAQKAMRPVAADADNPQTKSKYASYAAIDRMLRPIYTEHGFGLSFDTGDCPLPEHVRMLAYVTHVGGGARTYRADMPADGKGAKGGDVMTKTHATGAAMAYGMRYLLKMIFNVAVGEDDVDGNGGKKAAPPPPDGQYDQWLLDLVATADTGIDALRAMWKNSKKVYTEHLTTTNGDAWMQLKVKAQTITTNAAAKS